MRHTQGQIRELLDLPVETFRQWRDGLRTLTRHKGHGPTFSPGEVVALALLSDLVNIYGVRVNTVAARIDELFELCPECSWPALEQCVIVISADRTCMMQADDRRRDIADGTVLCIPCRPIIKRLQTRLITAELNEGQAKLQFPPTPLATRVQ